MKRSSIWFILVAVWLAACSADEEAQPQPQPGRQLEPLPPPPVLAIDPEAMPGAEGELAVVAARPIGDAPEGARPTITFSRPVVPLQAVRDEEALAPPARIEPQLPGQWRWLGSASVEFVPDQPLPPASEFTVTVPAGLRSIDGASLDQDHVFTFRTPLPKLLRVEPRADFRWLPEQPRLAVTFDRPVRDLADHAWLEVRGGQGRVALRLVGEGPVERAPPGTTRYELESTRALQKGQQLEIVIGASLPTVGGSLPLGSEERIAYEIHGPMAIDGAQACLWDHGGCVWGPVVIRTTNPVAPEKLRERLSVEPPVEIDWDAAFSQTPAHWSTIQTPHVVLPGNWKPGTEYRLSVGAGLEDDFGQRASAWSGTVSTDDRPPSFDVGREVALLESEGPGELPVQTVNLAGLDVEVWPLTPERMARALASTRGWVPPSPPALQRKLSTPAKANVSRFTPIPVREALGGARSGLFIARVRAPELHEPWQRERRVVGQITDLAVHSKLGATSGVVWVTRLSSGLPVTNASIALWDKRGDRLWTGRSDDDGLVFVPGLAELVPSEDQSWRWEAPFALVTAQVGEEIGATLSSWMEGLSPAAFDLQMDWDGGTRRSLGTIFADRGIYRPGETAHVKGVARVRRLGKVERPPVGTQVAIVLRDPTGQEAATAEAEVGPFGTFHADLPIPADARLGHFFLQATGRVEGTQLEWYGELRVEEYRAPRFQVDVSTAADSAIAGEPIEARALARYLFGGAMSGATVRWSVARTTVDYQPPGHDGYAFGNQLGWWDDREPPPSRAIAASGTGETDRSGVFAFRAGVAEAPAGRTWTHTVEVEVEDVDRQRVAARASIPVHPAALYAGVRLGSQGFAEVGRQVPLDLIAVEPDGTVARGAPIAVRVLRRDWQSIRKRGFGGHWYTESEPVEEEVATCSVQTAAEAQRCIFTPEKAGLHVVEATVRDGQGRSQTSRAAFYVVGGGWVSWQRGDTDRIELVADRALYEPGQTAKILVKSPWPEAEALVTTERAGVRTARRIRLQGAASTIEVPVDEEAIPNVFVGVVLVRGRVEGAEAEAGADPGRPEVRVGYVELQVEKASRRLTVDVRPDAAEKRPGDELRVQLQVRDHQGRGGRTELAVWAVDEAVLRLTGYELPDLVEAMNPPQGLSVRIGEPLLFLVERQLYGEKGETAGGGGGEEGGFGIRSRFRTTAHWAPSVITDAQGRATVSFELPDNLTTWRILAVAVDERDRFGGGQSSVQVARPLLALPALPRLARTGDRFEAGVVLHGHRFSAPSVQVRATASEGVSIDGPATQEVAVVEGRPVEVRFPFVGEQPGEATLRFFVQGGGEKDAVEIKVPVRLPVSMEAVATTGDTKEKVTEGLVPPGGVMPDVGGLEITLASSALAGLQENFAQLVAYPWGCLEQEASRLVPFVALREIAGAQGVAWQGAADLLDPEALASRGSDDPDQVARAAVRAIEDLQNPDGSYRYWPSSSCPSPPGSAWAVWSLARAREVGYPVDEAALGKGQAWLADVVAAGQCISCGFGCRVPGEATRVMALWTLARTGAARPSYYAALYEKRTELPLFAQAMLADAIFVGGGDRTQGRQLLQELINHARETPAGVHFEEPKNDAWAYLWSSDVRTTAIVLGTLAAIQPDHPFVPKIARWLQTARGRDGRWQTTQDAAFALASLTEVMRRKETEAPDFRAVVALAGEELASARFAGRSLDVERREIPASSLAKGDLVFSKEGPGVLYYAARLRYAPQQMPTDPMDRGFAVQRWFEPWDGGGQGRRFFAGDLVRMRLRVATPQTRHYPVVVVPIPAGLEAIDTSLASTAALPPAGEERQEKPDDWIGRFFVPFPQVELRDDRVALFAEQLPPGVHEFEVALRATTPGQFALPPATAEEMYAPEVFGRSDGGRFEVLDASEVAGR